MYIRAVHAESSIPALRQLIRENPLGILTTGIPSTTHAFLQSSHIPFVLKVDDDADITEFGRLQGHLARQNPQSKTIIESLTSPTRTETTHVLEQEVLVLFTAATHHYVTPKFYTETKPSTAKVVPTWQYAAAQAYGKATIHFDSKSEATAEFFSKHLHELSQLGEKNIMGYTGTEGRPDPWTVSQAPERYVELLTKAIIGIDIQIERLEGKFKMGQELSQGDLGGMVKGFQEMDSEVAKDMARIVTEKNAEKIAR
ncbi:hypothetical protein ACHAQA_006231 [Verticillium albo-atrum]